jgi:hypothetical protein
LENIAVKRSNPPYRRNKNLCADAGYTGKSVAESRGLKNNPSKRARRWVVEVAHSWFNRFRKLLVRYEKLGRSFMALNYLAAAIITFRKISGSINIIYG